MKKSKSLSRSPFLIRGHQLRSALMRLQLSLRDIEELLFERGVASTCETIRSWCDKFGGSFAHRVNPAWSPPQLGVQGRPGYITPGMGRCSAVITVDSRAFAKTSAPGLHIQQARVAAPAVNSIHFAVPEPISMPAMARAAYGARTCPGYGQDVTWQRSSS